MYVGGTARAARPTAMLDRLRKIFAPPATPIGVDFGTDRLRLAQVEPDGEGVRLVAAHATDVPPGANASPAARAAFLVPAVRRALAEAPFAGRRAVLALPAAATHLEHLRLARMTPDQTAAALPAEAAGRLPFDAGSAVLRHLVAGDVHAAGAAGAGGAAEVRQEVVLLATPRAQVDGLLASAASAGLDVVGLEAEGPASVAAFGRVYRRAIDREQCLMFVDLGRDRTRAAVARAGRVLFARALDVGGADVERLAGGTESAGDRAALHARLSAAVAAAHDVNGPTRRDPGAAAGTADANSSDPAPADAALAAACRPAVDRLVEELSACRRYHEATFPDRPVERLVFLGGARTRRSCAWASRGRCGCRRASPTRCSAAPARPTPPAWPPSPPPGSTAPARTPAGSSPSA